jgi:hypothetical protein
MALQDFPSAISPVGQAIQADPRVESDRQRLATMGTQLTQQEADASAMQRVLEESQRAAANREAQLKRDSIANLLSGMDTMLTSEQRGMEWKLPGGEPARPEHLASGRVGMYPELTGRGAEAVRAASASVGTDTKDRWVMDPVTGQPVKIRSKRAAGRTYGTPGAQAVGLGQQPPPPVAEEERQPVPPKLAASILEVIKKDPMYGSYIQAVVGRSPGKIWVRTIYGEETTVNIDSLSYQR